MVSNTKAKRGVIRTAEGILGPIGLVFIERDSGVTKARSPLGELLCAPMAGVNVRFVRWPSDRGNDSDLGVESVSGDSSISAGKGGSSGRAVPSSMTCARSISICFEHGPAIGLQVHVEAANADDDMVQSESVNPGRFSKQSILCESGSQCAMSSAIIIAPEGEAGAGLATLVALLVPSALVFEIVFCEVTEAFSVV
jgi:hypothetical protein